MASVGFPYKKNGSPLGGPRNHTGTYESPFSSYSSFSGLCESGRKRECGQ